MTAADVKRCAVCGRLLPASRPRVYSRFTGAYYCVDDRACAKRAARKTRKNSQAVAA